MIRRLSPHFPLVFNVYNVYRIHILAVFSSRLVEHSRDAHDPDVARMLLNRITGAQECDMNSQSRKVGGFSGPTAEQDIRIRETAAS